VKPLIHAKVSVKRHGGCVEDYLLAGWKRKAATVADTTARPLRPNETHPPRLASPRHPEGTNTMIEVSTGAPFKREERFIVIKRKHMNAGQESAVRSLLERIDVKTVECVVVESDWPEYETVWCMVEYRVTGATPEPAGELVERVARALCVAGHSGFNPDEIMPNDGPRWRYYEPSARAAIAAMPDRAALVAELERLKDENKNLSHHVVSGVLGDLLDLAEREALLDFIKHQRGLPDTRDEHISTLRTQLAASRVDVAQLREALNAMVSRWKSSKQNWTQAACDADRELSVTIQNTVLAALDGFPIEQAIKALGAL
jgi:uncharacterized coiled-coil protein SlyX